MTGKYQQNPTISASATVRELELKAGYWVQCMLKGKYNSKTMKHEKYACVEIRVDSETEEFIVTASNNVKFENWKKD